MNARSWQKKVSLHQKREGCGKELRKEDRQEGREEDAGKVVLAQSWQTFPPPHGGGNTGNTVWLAKNYVGRTPQIHKSQ